MFLDSGWIDTSSTLMSGELEFRIFIVTDKAEGLELDSVVFDVVNPRNATDFICSTDFHLHFFRSI